MWVLEKDGKTINTFDDKKKSTLEKEGWKVKLDTLAEEKKKAAKKEASKDVN